ncbi:MAG: hypothetical protein KAH11_03135 [Rhodospirillales bacterium]|nr:hypothetical protein [Rhodospirillales bacterium]
MDTIQFSVHEFMTLMGILNEQERDGDGVPKTSVWHKWKKRYQDLDKDLEKLDMMDRADMLFDGKVKFEDVPREDIQEVLGLVQDHIKHEQSLIEEHHPDADPDEVEIWQTLHARLETSLEWDG